MKIDPLVVALVGAGVMALVVIFVAATRPETNEFRSSYDKAGAAHGNPAWRYSTATPAADAVARTWATLAASHNTIWAILEAGHKYSAPLTATAESELWDARIAKCLRETPTAEHELLGLTERDREVLCQAKTLP